jgi:hypothetical protein
LDEFTDDLSSFINLLRGGWTKIERAEKGSIISTLKLESKKIQAMIDKCSDDGTDADALSARKGGMDDSLMKKKNSKDKVGSNSGASGLRHGQVMGG